MHNQASSKSKGIIEDLYTGICLGTLIILLLPLLFPSNLLVTDWIMWSDLLHFFWWGACLKSHDDDGSVDTRYIVLYWRTDGGKGNLLHFRIPDRPFQQGVWRNGEGSTAIPVQTPSDSCVCPLWVHFRSLLPASGPARKVEAKSNEFSFHSK